MQTTSSNLNPISDQKINGIFISDLQIGFFSLLCFRPTLYMIAATQELLQFAKGFKFPILNKMNFSRDEKKPYSIQTKMHKPYPISGKPV